MSDNAIEIRGLEKTFPGVKKNVPGFKLGPLDLTAPQGAIYGFIGPNGAGKSTTIDLMFGIGNEDAGEIRALGLDHRRDEVEFKRRVACVSPEMNFGAWGKVRNAVRFVRGFYPNWDHDYCERLMKAFGLGADDPIVTLSFGARTKLALMMAMSRRPEVLILDEPTTGLDAVSKRLVFSELLAAVNERNCSILISSHGLTDLERFADHIGLIKDGRLLIEGRTDEIVERYRMTDFEADPAMQFNGVEGFTLVERDGQRCRGLFDRLAGGVERLTSAGAREISSTPVTLEELFVALVKERATT